MDKYKCEPELSYIRMENFLEFTKQNGVVLYYKILYGYDSGENARIKEKLDECEKDDNWKCIISIPNSIWDITPSFFRGMFEKSIKKYKDKFFDHYQFQCESESMDNMINDRFNYTLFSL